MSTHIHRTYTIGTITEQGGRSVIEWLESTPITGAWVKQDKDGKTWYAIQDNFRNFLRSQECQEIGQLVAALP